MGMYHSTYFGYGTRIPDTHSDYLETALAEHGTVTYLQAGGYDRNMTFLVITSTLTGLDLGTYRSIAPQVEVGAKYHAWNHELRAAATALGTHDVPAPAWIVVPDLS